MRQITKALVGALVGIGIGASAQAATIVVGGKDFTEQLLMAEITSQLLQAHGFDVDKKDGMASTLVRNAQVNGQIDVYWEYTGTSLVTYNKISERMNAADTYAKVKELDAEKGLTWLEPSAANDTYGLAVRQDNPKTDSLNTISDLAKAYNDGRDMTLALGAEFSKRPDALPGVEKEYGFKISRANLSTMADGLTYGALKDEKADIAVVFTTDGRIAAFNFRVLKDDKEFFPNYALAPVIRTETLDAHPELADLLNGVSSHLTDEVMQRLNGEVDVDRKSIEEVAAGFLKEIGMM